MRAHDQRAGRETIPGRRRRRVNPRTVARLVGTAATAGLIGAGAVGAGRVPAARARLVSRWDFDSEATPVGDSVGNHHGRLLPGHGQRVTAPAQIGAGALACQGKGPAALIPDAPGLRFGRTASFSLAAWIYLPPAASARTAPQAIVVKKRAAAAGAPAGSAYGIWLTADGRWMSGSQAGDLLGPAATPGWHHVAIVQDVSARQRELFIDGVLAASATGTAAAKAKGASLCVGGAENAAAAFVGVVDDVRLYDAALGAAEVTALADLTGSGTGGLSRELWTGAAGTQTAEIPLTTAPSFSDQIGALASPVVPAGGDQTGPPPALAGETTANGCAAT